MSGRINKILPLALLWLFLFVMIWVVIREANREDINNRKNCITGFSIAKTSHDSLVYLTAYPNCARAINENNH